ncbi:alpha/beta fold hydrolase [Caballeronia ptereochthonis]|uniref:Alpha/beta hydrolase n=1 Tax=Caballeronia ptereochthonis TaxID=1777144 RepID=A0A158B2Y7_9BURK|nr:alpha/beta fold hydrolase [Caballeronia ptereochthonis]SAK64329.1 alpha/beta hydrolase [Caballeronia ptereochthonis]
MTPIVFEGRFGWLHGGQGKHGVVLCKPFGHEESWVHKAMRYLADELSRQGLPVLRFDYLGTGDSVGIGHEGDRLDDFVADITEAVECLRKEAGVTKITLCGLRLGGTLAALASHHASVESLALLAPVVNGRHYLRELTALRKSWLETLPLPMRTMQIDSPFNVLGQKYSAAFRSQMSGFDLGMAMRRQPAIPKRVFVADIQPGASQPLYAALRDRGVEVQTNAFDDYFDFMQDTSSSVLPEKTLKQTAQWIAESVIDSSPGDLNSVRTRKAARLSMGDNAIIETPEAIERPVVFGAAGLFGILCEPRDRLVGGPAVVITNTAGNAHHGDSRLSVRIAREMARRGIASMRIDARGIGDSPPLPLDHAPNTITPIHAETIIEDVATAAAWLKRKGYDSIVTFGICSGAYSALRASLVEPAIEAVIAINLQRFYISEKMSLQELRNQMCNTMARLGPAILKPTKWWLVLSGKRGFRPIAKAFASNATARLQSQMFGVTRRDALGADEKPLTHPHGVVQRLERKGVDTLLLYGVGDDGLDQLNAYFGRYGQKLSRLTKVRTTVCEDIDHSLYDPRALAKVVALSESFLRNLHPKSSPVMDTVSPLGISRQL